MFHAPRNDAADGHFAPIIAIALFLSVVALPQQARSEGEALAEFEEARDLLSEGRLADAIPHAERATALAKHEYGDDQLPVADSLMLEGKIKADDQRFDEAESRYKEALRIYERQDPTGQQAALAAYVLGGFYRAQNKLGDAVAFYGRSLEIQQQIQAPDSMLEQTTTLALATTYLDIEDYLSATPLLERLIDIEINRNGPDTDQVAEFLSVLARAQHDSKNYQAAKQSYERCLAIKESRFFLFRDWDSIAATRLNYGTLLHDIGHYENATDQLRKLLRYQESKTNTEPSDTVETCRRLAQSLAYQDAGSEAQVFAEKAVALAQSSFGETDGRTATAIDALASIYQLQGRWEDAEKLYRRAALMTDTDERGGKRAAAIRSLNLAGLYYQREEFERACSVADQALATLQSLQPAAPDDVAAASNALGMIYWGLGKHDLADTLLRSARRDVVESLGEEHPDVAILENNLAMNLFFLRAYDEAAKEAAHAIAVAEKKLGANHSAAMAPRITLAITKAAQDQWQASGSLLDVGIRTLVTHIDRVLPALTAAEQLSVLRAGPYRPYHAGLSMAVARPSDQGLCNFTAGWLANMKSLGHETLATISLLQRESSLTETAALARQLGDVRQRLAVAAARGASGQAVTRESDGTFELEQRERDLVHQIGGQLAAIYRGSPWTEVADIRSQIPPDSVLVDFARVRIFDFHAKSWPTAWQAERYAAWIIPTQGRGEIQVVDLGDADSIDRLIASYRANLRNALGEKGTVKRQGERSAEQSLRESGRLLSKALLGPLAGGLHGSDEGEALQKLIICPDGDLWLVPWAALPFEDDRYLVERYAIQTITCSRDLTRTRGPLIDSSPAVVFANPDFNLSPDGNSKRNLTGPDVADLSTQGTSALRRIAPVNRLAGTADEASLLKPLLSSLTNCRPVTYTDGEATETHAKQMKRPRVAHFATHAFFLPDQRLSVDAEVRAAMSAIGSRSTNSALMESGEIPRSPFLRSGLLLAGCNNPNVSDASFNDDGVLTGAEVLGIDLMGTELVVLSACDTGVGDVRCGEGVAGLRQAFLIAGANSVLATLWHVDDAATADLMAGFFGHLEADASHADALARAQRQFIAERRMQNGAAHPVFWGAFTLTQ